MVEKILMHKHTLCYIKREWEGKWFNKKKREIFFFLLDKKRFGLMLQSTTSGLNLGCYPN